MSFPAVIIIGLSLMIGTLILVTKWEHRRIRRVKEAGVALGLRPFGEDEPLALVIFAACLVVCVVFGVIACVLLDAVRAAMKRPDMRRGFDVIT